MAQDYYDVLQPFDFLVTLLDDNKASLGLRYIAQNDERLRPAYPAVLVSSEGTERELHATGIYLLTFRVDIWVFHAELTVGKAKRSREDIELATAIRKLIHTDTTMGGHIVHGFVDGEFPGVTSAVIGANVNTIVTTRITWQGTNRAPFEVS